MILAIVCLVIVAIAIILFKTLSFFRGGTGFLPPASEIREIHIAYTVKDDESSDEIGALKEFNLTDEDRIKSILQLLEDKEFPRFPLLNSDNMDFNESWFINIFPKNTEPFYIYVDKHNISEYKVKDSDLYKYLRKNYT